MPGQHIAFILIKEVIQLVIATPSEVEATFHLLDMLLELLQELQLLPALVTEVVSRQIQILKPVPIKSTSNRVELGELLEESLVVHFWQVA